MQQKRNKELRVSVKELQVEAAWKSTICGFDSDRMRRAIMTPPVCLFSTKMISLAEVVSFASPKMTRNLCATLPNAYCKPKDVPPKRVDGITRMKRSGAPKQAFSAYVWYGSGMRVKIKEESPHMLQKDIMKELRAFRATIHTAMYNVYQSDVYIL